MNFNQLHNFSARIPYGTPCILVDYLKVKYTQISTRFRIMNQSRVEIQSIKARAETNIDSDFLQLKYV